MDACAHKRRIHIFFQMIQSHDPKLVDAAFKAALLGIRNKPQVSPSTTGRGGPLPQPLDPMMSLVMKSTDRTHDSSGPRVVGAQRGDAQVPSLMSLLGRIAPVAKHVRKVAMQPSTALPHQ